MRKPLLAAMCLALATSATGAAAQTLPAEEAAFVKEHLSSIVVLTPTRLDDPAVTSVFAVPFYRVKLEINDGTATALTTITVARVGDTLVAVSQPGEESERPDILKMLKPAFKLKDRVAAETVQRALDVVYPFMGTSEDEKGKTFRQNASDWQFLRGKFFDNSVGFVLTTDASGSVTGVKYSLKL